MSNTADILKEAVRITGGDRANWYGDKRVNHENIAALWNAYIWRRKDPSAPLDGADVAMLMCLLKCARTLTGKGHADSYVDGAAYFAMSGELSERLADTVVDVGRNVEEGVEINGIVRQFGSTTTGLENLDQEYPPSGRYAASLLNKR